MRSRIVTLLSVLAFAGTAADERQIYEDMTQIEIGRVFLSPAERDALEAKRRQSRSVADSRPLTTSDTNRESSAEPKLAAGYIQRSGRAPSRYVDGEFVRSIAAPERFPGDVRIVRHAPANPPDAEHADATGPDEVAGGDH